VYQRAKGESDKRPFGTQLDVASIGYEWINHSLQPTVLESHDFRVTIGATRAQPYRASLFNISAMNLGALSANPILAPNAGITPAFIVVDGAEGGTGAAPLEFTDHVGAPLQEGLLLVHNTLVGLDLRDKIKIGCAGKVVSAFDIARMLALGADWCNSARGFMFALGCVQAQTCHTGNCPTGVTTQDAKRQQALDVPSKADRVYHFHQNTLLALKELVQAAGLDDPAGITADHIVRRNSEHGVKLLANLLPFVKTGELLDGESPLQVFRTYWPISSAKSFSPTPLSAGADLAARSATPAVAPLRAAQPSAAA